MANFPDAQIFDLVVVGVSNQVTAPQMQCDQQLLATAEQQAQQYLTAAAFSDNTVIQESAQATILQLQQLIAQEFQVNGTSFQITATKPQVDVL